MEKENTQLERETHRIQDREKKTDETHKNLLISCALIMTIITKSSSFTLFSISILVNISIYTIF